MQRSTLFLFRRFTLRIRTQLIQKQFWNILICVFYKLQFFDLTLFKISNVQMVCKLKMTSEMILSFQKEQIIYNREISILKNCHILWLYNKWVFETFLKRLLSLLVQRCIRLSIVVVYPNQDIKCKKTGYIANNVGKDLLKFTCDFLQEALVSFLLLWN